MAWWLWFLVGLGLLVVEMVIPGGLFALFFGAAALVVGALTGLGIAGPPWLQWVLFSILALVALGLLRKRLRNRLISKPAAAIDSMVGQSATLLISVAPGAIGRAELGGSSWNVRNVGAATLESGQRVSVQSVDGLTLNVQLTQT